MKLDRGNMLINCPHLMRCWQIITLSSAIGFKDKLSVLVNAWLDPKISQNPRQAVPDDIISIGIITYTLQ